MIRCDAGLPRIGEPAPGDSPGRGVEVCIGQDHAGTLAPQFKGDRCQVMGSSCHNNFCDPFTAGINNMIPGQFQNACAGFHAAFHYLDAFTIQVLG